MSLPASTITISRIWISFLPRISQLKSPPEGPSTPMILLEPIAPLPSYRDYVESLTQVALELENIAMTDLG